jgi:hypothetical protein
MNGIFCRVSGIEQGEHMEDVQILDHEALARQRDDPDLETG